MSDRIISYLRTIVPKAWGVVVGALLVWLGQHAPWAVDALDFLGIDLNSPVVVLTVVGLTEAAWYWLWRRIEPHVPDALSRLAMGSARTPVYVNPSVYPVATYNTDDRVMLTDGALVTIGAAIMEPGVRVPSYTVTYASGQQTEVRETDIVGRA